MIDTRKKEFWDATLEHCTQEERDYILSVLSADVRPNRHGYWKVVSDAYGDNAYICECSECADTVWVYKYTVRKWKYCPKCGAIMDAEPKVEKGDSWTD